MFFLHSTPKSGTPVFEIPEFVKGQFLTVEFSNKSLTTEIHRVERHNAHHIEIYSKDVTYLDSLSMDSLGINKIDTAYFNGRNLIVVQDGNERQLNIKDSLKSGLEEIYIAVDLSKNLFATKDTLIGEMRCANGTYYCNLQSDSLPYKSIIAFEDNDNHISFWSSRILGEGSEKNIDMLPKYLEIGKKRTGKFQVYSYFVDFTDQTFFDLVKNEQIFPRHIWYKIDSNKNEWVWWAIGSIVLIFIGIIFFLKMNK